MPFTGTLRNWNDDRGYGFIAPTQGGAEVFVHVSAFARDGARPTVGEKLSYELGHGRDGKQQAINVVRLAIGTARPQRATESEAPRSQTNWLGVLLFVAVLGVGSTWMYKEFSARQHRNELAAQPPAPLTYAPANSLAPATYNCDGRTYCSQMTSCAEAKWFISNCPGTKMDGNNDGVPCQEQWCN